MQILVSFCHAKTIHYGGHLGQNFFRKLQLFRQNYTIYEYQFVARHFKQATAFIIGPHLLFTSLDLHVTHAILMHASAS